MATKIKIITAKEFIDVTPDGDINLITSRQLLIDIAKIEHPPVDYQLLVDFRDTSCCLSITDVYELAAELSRNSDLFERKVALLVLPGIDFDLATFFKTCANNRGFSLNVYKDYEKAIRWILSTEDMPDNVASVKQTDVSDGK